MACVLYEMLGGRPPFQADTVRALLAKQVTEQPGSIRALRPEVRSTVDQAVAKALAKDPPRSRFATAAEFLDALGAPGPDARRTMTKTKSIAVLPFVNAGPDPDNEYLSDGITDELIRRARQSQWTASRLVAHLGLCPQGNRRMFARSAFPLGLRGARGNGRRSGDKLRITAQLTSTDDGQLVWSQRYDRQLEPLIRGRGRDCLHHRQHAARQLACRSGRAAGTPVHRQRQSVRSLSARPPRVEQAHAGGRARWGGALRAGDGRGSRVCSGLHGTRRFVRPAGGLPQRTGA